MTARNTNKVASYAFLYIHSFPFLQPHFLADAEKFNFACDHPDAITTTADKLKYHRHKMGLLQQEVAQAVRIDRTTYVQYESGQRDIIDICLLERIATALGVEAAELLDNGYIAFLYRGQASQVKALRESLGMTLTEFAGHLGVEYSTVRKWENGAARMTRRMWQRVVRDIAQNDKS